MMCSNQHISTLSNQHINQKSHFSECYEYTKIQLLSNRLIYFFYLAINLQLFQDFKVWMLSPLRKP